MSYLKIFFTSILLCLTLNISNAQAKHYQTKRTNIVQTTNKQNGKASFYGNRYHNGRKTASGERFNKNALTAAHRSLPFGTLVKVTNKDNGKSVIVKINDRGPMMKSRIIDLSVKAFSEIASLKKGVVDVYIEVINEIPSQENT